MLLQVILLLVYLITLHSFNGADLIRTIFLDNIHKTN